MTSAARPTWQAALGSGGGLRDGSSAAPTRQFSSKDQPGHLKLKLRQIGQDAPEEMRERKRKADAALLLGTESLEEEKTVPVKTSLISGDSDVEIASDDEDENQRESDTEGEKDFVENESDKYSEEEDGEDDEEAELMRELEKIRREREAERLEKERKAAEQDPRSILAGNPLLATPSDAGSTFSSSTFTVKRRWDDDVVFKNQAKGLNDKPQKRFINDTTRSDFHRRFMDRYIK